MNVLYLIIFFEIDIGTYTEAKEWSYLIISQTRIKPRCHDQTILQPQNQIVKR